MKIIRFPLKLAAYAIILAIWLPGTTAVADSGFLTDYSGLKPGPEGGIDRVWANPKYTFPAQFGKYKAFSIDPITVYLSSEGKDRGVPVAELNMLTNEFRAKLIESISGKYTVTDKPGDGVLRFVIALTDVESTNAALDTITSIVPMARIFSFVKKQVTGADSFVGSASIEGVIVDGGTGETLMAFTDKRVGEKSISNATDELNDAREAFEWWGKRLRKVLDQAHAKGG